MVELKITKIQKIIKVSLLSILVIHISNSDALSLTDVVNQHLNQPVDGYTNELINVAADAIKVKDTPTVSFKNPPPEDVAGFADLSQYNEQRIGAECDVYNSSKYKLGNKECSERPFFPNNINIGDITKEVAIHYCYRILPGNTSSGLDIEAMNEHCVAWRIKENEPVLIADEKKNVGSQSPEKNVSSHSISEQEIEIKGLKINMSIAEAKAIIDKFPNHRYCVYGKVSDPSFLKFGDTLINCNPGSFSYFGKSDVSLVIYLENDKIKSIALGEFSSNWINDSSHSYNTEVGFPIPEPFKSLSEKYNVKPDMRVTQGQRFLESYIKFSDKLGSVLSISGDLDPEAKSYRHLVIELLSSNYTDYVQKRENTVNEDNVRQQQAIENEKKGDL